MTLFKKNCFKTKFQTNYRLFNFVVTVYSKDYTHSDCTRPDPVNKNHGSSTIMAIRIELWIFDQMFSTKKENC